MPALRYLVSVFALCFTVAIHHSVAGPGDEDNQRPTETGGIWVHPLDDTSMFESHPVANTALKAKKIKLLGSSTALRDQLAKRGKSGGAIVVIDGAQMFANPTEAYAHALALVKKHGKNATYLFLNEGSSQVLPGVLTDHPLRASGPINAAGIVDLALRKTFTTEGEMPERITCVSRERAEAVLKSNAQLGRTSTPSDHIPWAEGHSIVVLARAPFDRSGIGPTPLAGAIMQAATAEKVSYIGYEVLGGESAVVGNRLIALASECRVGITRPVEFRIQVYSRGDDGRAASKKLGETQAEWLANLNGGDHLYDAALRPAVTFKAGPVADLYKTATTVDNEREITINYNEGRFHSVGKVAKVKVKYEGSRIYIESDADYPIEVRGNKPGERAGKVLRGRTEVATLDGPVVEVRLKSNNGEETSIMLVDARHRTDVASALYPASAPNFETTASAYTRAVYEGGTFAGGGSVSAPARPITPGDGVVVDLGGPVVRPGTSLVPPTETRGVDPSVLDAVKYDFPDLGERARNLTKPPFEIMDSEAVRQMAITIRKPEFGNLLVIGEPGAGKTVVVESFIYEVVHGRVDGVPKNTVFLQLDASSLVGNTMYRGQLEKKLESLFAASEKVNIILFADEVHGLLGAGRTMGSDNDIFQGKFKTQMANGKLRLLGTSTPAEVDVLLTDPALADRFTRYDVKPWSKEKVLEAMAKWAKRFKLPDIPIELREYIYELSEKYAATGGQPRKVAKFLNQYYGTAAIDRFETMTRDNINQVAKEFYQLTDADFDPELQRRRALDIGTAMDAKIVGQTAAKKLLRDALRKQLWNVGARDSGPMRILFSGPPGLGKTELASAYGQARAGNRFHRIAMSGEYGRDQTLLFAEIGRILTANGQAVLFFDEFEKAPLSVQRAFLTALDKGYVDFTPGGKGKNVVRIYLKNVDIIMATNAGGEYIMSHQGETEEVRFGEMERRGLKDSYIKTHTGKFVESEFIDSLKQDGLAPEVVDRFGKRAIPFFPATEEEFRSILNLHLERMIRERSGRETVGPFDVTNKSAYVDAMVKKYWAPDMSMRTSIDAMELELEGKLADALEADGRQPGVKAPTDCQRLLIQLSAG